MKLTIYGIQMFRILNECYLLVPSLISSSICRNLWDTERYIYISKGYFTKKTSHHVSRKCNPLRDKILTKKMKKDGEKRGGRQKKKTKQQKAKKLTTGNSPLLSPPPFIYEYYLFIYSFIFSVALNLKLYFWTIKHYYRLTFYH